MCGNSILNKARYSDDTDEWYTPYELIEEELAHYEQHFRGKVVLCNCDDPYESNFTYFFLRNFRRLKIKKLICTSYARSRIASIKNNVQLCLQDDNGQPIHIDSGYVLSVSKVGGSSNGELTEDEIRKLLQKKGVIRKLKGDGDFRSEECLAYLTSADIVVTNPPFSLFAELFTILMQYNKDFLLIGNQNAITYKEVFPYIKQNKVWVGYRFGDMAFRVPPDTKPRKTRFWIDENGQKWRSLGNAMWLTNLDVSRRHRELKLTQIYDPEHYPKYDNYDAVHVQRVDDIPRDYDGVMGVPITFLKYYNEEQFEIVGEANHGSDNEYDLFKPLVAGREKFKRILIRKKQNNDFRILDLFCGAGGFSYGIHQNPHFRTVVALDNDSQAASTFKRNMPETEVVVGDITDERVKNQVVCLSLQKGVDMIIGGPPCQGYSMKGKKLGLEDPRNFLFREYLSIVRKLKPRVFVIENVKTILGASKGWFKKQIVAEITNLGYDVKVGVLNSADFGVPQSRERAIFICFRDAHIELPKPSVTCLKAINGTSKKTTVRHAISDLAYLDSGEGSFEDEYRTEPNSRYQILMRNESKLLYNHKASNHKQIAIDKLKMIPPEQGKEFLPKELHGKQKFKSTWGRLKWDDISPTIDTRFDAASNGTNNHPVLNRAITPREAARLQSFDDKFVFYGPKVSVRKQIGNAVPPLLAKAIADAILSGF